MARRYFKISLSHEMEIHVFFESMSGLIINFVVKLLMKWEDSYYEVVRFDSGDDCPHKDILNVQGEVTRKIWYEFLDNKQGLDLAIKDLKDNSEIYAKRFKEWLKR